MSRKFYVEMNNHDNCEPPKKNMGAKTQGKKKSPISAEADLFITAGLQWREDLPMGRLGARNGAVGGSGELAASLARGQWTARTVANGMTPAAEAVDIHEAERVFVHYRFKSWPGEPCVDLCFASQGAEKIITASTHHAHITDAMQRHADELPSDTTLRFDRQRRDDEGERRPRREQQQLEEDEA
ncbi:hypothetical protein AU476_26705 [Cupriavidus sp. UYMSc13B]|nr:hypothetical protein AU476_26705 [Cupriavidus sp. UYMSc13B]